MFYHIRLLYQNCNVYLKYNVVSIYLKRQNDEKLKKYHLKALSESVFKDLFGENVKCLITKQELKTNTEVIYGFDFVSERKIIKADVLETNDVVLFKIVSDFDRTNFIEAVKFLNASYRKQAIGVETLEGFDEVKSVIIVVDPLEVGVKKFNLKEVKVENAKLVQSKTEVSQQFPKTQKRGKSK